MTAQVGLPPAAVPQMPRVSRVAAIGFAERVGFTFVQSFIAALVAMSPSGAAARVDWAQAFSIALFAAAVTVVTSALMFVKTLRVDLDRWPFGDLVYRTALTFVQTLAGLMLASMTMSALTFHWDSALKAATVAAGQALLKSLAGIGRPDTRGASVFVPAPPPRAPRPQPAV